MALANTLFEKATTAAVVSILLLVSSTGLKIVATTESSRDHEDVTDVIESEVDKDWPSALSSDISDHLDVTGSVVENEETETTPVDRESMTIQDRYQLPPMSLETERDRFRVREQRESSSVNGEHTSTVRLSSAEYNKRLVAVARRVDHMSSTLRTLRHSFSLFSQDVQQHMLEISEQIEALKISSSSSNQHGSTTRATS